MEGLTSYDQEQVEFVNEAELLLLRARRIAHRIKERLWSVMREHETNGPHLPAASRDSTPPAEVEPERDGERKGSSRQPQKRDAE